MILRMDWITLFLLTFFELFSNDNVFALNPAMVAEWLDLLPCNLQRQQARSYSGLNPAWDIYSRLSRSFTARGFSFRDPARV